MTMPGLSKTPAAEAIRVHADGTDRRTVLMTLRFVATQPTRPKAIGPYSQAVDRRRASCSPPARSRSIPPPWKSWPRASRADRAGLENLEAVLEAAGSDLARVLKTTVFLPTWPTSPR